MNCCKRLLALCAVVCSLTETGTFTGAQELQRLTRDGRRKFSPVVIDGGRTLLYCCVLEESRKVHVLKRDMETGFTELLEPTNAAHLYDPAVSPQGRYFVCSVSSGNPQLSLRIIDQTANTRHEYRPPGSRSTARHAIISLKHQRVFFTVNTEGGQQIASVDLQGGDFRHLAKSPGINSWPSLSPDEETIAFTSSRGGDLDIYTMDVRGENVRRLTQEPLRDVRAAWSPDGERIAFCSVRDGNHNIFVMDADGTSARRLTRDPGRDDFPTWHPDGKHLVIVAERAGQSDLYRLAVTE